VSRPALSVPLLAGRSLSSLLDAAVDLCPTSLTFASFFLVEIFTSRRGRGKAHVNGHGAAPPRYCVAYEPNQRGLGDALTPPEGGG